MRPAIATATACILALAAAARADAPGGKAAPKPRLPAPFDPASLAPAFDSGAPAEGLRDYRMGRWTDAVGALRKAPAKDLRAQLLLALAEVRAGMYADAAPALLALEKSYPLLADYHRYWAAYALANAGTPAAAVDVVARVGADSPLRADAALLAAEARGMAGDLAGAAAGYQAYLDGFPRGPRLDDAAWNLADARTKLGDADGARAALRWLYAHAPTSPHAADAEKALRAGGAPLALDLAERVARGQVFFDAEMKDEAAAELDAALKLVAAAKAPDAATAGLACTARFLYGRTLHKQKKLGAAAAALAAAADSCTDPAMLEKALYHAANVNLLAGVPKKALYYATRLETELPASALADDAALFAARATAALGDAEKSVELLASIGVRYPDGDVAEDALWSLAWDAYRAGDFAGAEAWLDRAIATVPWVPTYYGAGRPLYWKARLRARAKDDAAARALWARCLRDYPLSYYAALSYARLAEVDPAAADAAWRDALSPVVPPPDKPELPPPGGAGAVWTFPPDALPAAPAFERGVELLRIGLADEARKEFATLPAGDDAARWLLAVLYDRAGAWTLAHNLPRRFLKGWDRHWPVGAWKKHWMVAYPRGFRAEIEPAAAAAGVPPALLFALVREESAFDPAVQSWADAVGLTQLLVSTARATAKKMAAFKAATITLDTLKDPALNVPIGARFLGDLLARWRHPLLAIGGYNAGGGAVAKWVADRGALPLDEYVESIPYDQTRGYTKRVFASYGVYTFLYEGTPLAVGLGTAAAAATGKPGK